MNSSREEALFEAALEKPADKRAAFLDAVCGDDTALRQRLEALLAAHEQPATELQESDLASVDAPTESSVTLLDESALTEESGNQIGRYKLLEKLGEGGFGSVWAAEQREPVKRRVALKIIKLGMDTKQVVARFEAERQALALMDHPNIAKVLDAGATDTGRPYFVMELVKGMPITKYCEQEKLDTKARLDLFIKVCQAIQHAHQKGIIHRDIKPSNIMVTLHDGVPVPKVIDFGIAKATQQELTEKTIYTQYSQFIGTPAYMSPEQAEMSGLDIDTRSDIYSLGVLLYELLTGTTPFDTKELMQSGLDEMRKIIREREPVRPSTRVSQTLESAPAKIINHQSRIENDLDWIVMKCLEKDRARRYETANGLAADIQRHLNNEPIVARPPSAAYKFQKAWRRNKVVYTAGALVVVALVTGLTVAAVGLRKAIAARQEAVTNEGKAMEAQANEARLRAQAEADALVARQRAYASDMNVAKQQLDANNLGRALDLLNRQRPAPGQKDLRGWEWRYLWQQTRSDAIATLCQESSEINALTISPDGSLLAFGVRHQGGVSVWDLRARKELVRLIQGSGYERTAFSPDGSFLAILSSEVSSSSGEEPMTLWIWNVAARQMVAEIPIGIAGCLGLAFSEDGQSLVTSTISMTLEPTGSRLGEITLWRVPDGERIVRYPALDQLGIDAGTSFAANADLSVAAYGSAEGKLRVMDLRSGRELWAADTGREYVLSLAFSPDGRVLACGDGFADAGLTLWDVETGKQMGRLDGHRAWVSSIVFLADGKQLVTSSADQTIRVWDVGSRECLSVLSGHRQEVWRLALLPDERTLISGAKDGTVFLWDIAKSPIRRGYQTLPDRVAASGFGADGRSIITLDHSGRVDQWAGASFEQKKPVLEIGPIDPDKYYLHQFSPDGRWLAAGSTNGVLEIWDVSRGTPARQWEIASGEIQVMDFLPTRNKVIAFSWQDRLLHELDLMTGEETQSWVGPPSMSWDSSGASPDGRFHLSIGYGGQTVLRDLLDRTNIITNLEILEGGTGSFSSGGDLLAVSSDLGYTRVWDTHHWKEVTTLSGVLNAMFTVAFSPDGKRVITSGGDHEAVKLFDAESWQDVMTLESQGSGMRGAKMSPDGNTITWSSVLGNVSIWQAPTWEEIAAAEVTQNTQSNQP